MSTLTISNPSAFVCGACQKPFASERSLHAHLKAHDLNLENYYHTYSPRYDLFTGELIKFKNKEKYFQMDFNNRGNMKKWLSTQTKEVAREYCERVIKQRIDIKKLKYSPTQVELRSCPLTPPASFLYELFGDYNSFCKRLGLLPRFDKKPQNKLQSGQLFCDSREQAPLSFSNPVQVKTLSFGDYGCEDSSIYFERKSLSDFIGTFGVGLERFINEVERAQFNNAYLIVIVESTMEQVAGFRNAPQISKKIKISPEALFYNVREILQKYLCVQFLFVSGRKEAARIIEKIYRSGIDPAQFDLQMNLDLGRL
jgi:hypothetical protein